MRRENEVLEENRMRTRRGENGNAELEEENEELEEENEELEEENEELEEENAGTRRGE